VTRSVKAESELLSLKKRVRNQTKDSGRDSETGQEKLFC
jgi:hypothetical protein